MNYDMLGYFTVKQNNNTDFCLDFEIPNNCNYSMVVSAGVYVITIQLNSGQTKPSTTFVPCKETVSAIASVLSIRFEQVSYSGTVLKRPTIVITQ